MKGNPVIVVPTITEAETAHRLEKKKNTYFDSFFNSCLDLICSVTVQNKLPFRRWGSSIQGWLASFDRRGGDRDWEGDEILTLNIFLGISIYLDVDTARIWFPIYEVR